MRKCFYRTHRIAQEIKKKISIIFQLKIKDPRINMVTISEVKISSDLVYAKVFVTFLNILDQKHEDMIFNNIKLLNSNMAKYIRFLLSKEMRLRIIPELTFFYDNSLIKGIQISNLVSKSAPDNKNHLGATNNFKSNK
ncbi:Ribosome-binding factor A [Candidatus Arsenophonus lipoptenae]|uniref:Ribosome-binding factor A n=1 Tax=Candidatus Arsenophonus lipoptenae TaxID=634113 RepID=A0A0X9W3S5_9GAMM|nr:30S ribosome-binding factor RbfA [Candidatus Arsenophonus lipoptenae]AMA65179.1 Ribosome-binding factor A [Candidatus Arsenophonus lipoptenae]